VPRYEEDDQVSIVSGHMEKMLDLAGQFAGKAEEVTQLRTFLSNQVEQNGDWQGQAADHFRELWYGEFAPALQNLTAALTDASGEVRRRQAMLLEASSLH